MKDERLALALEVCTKCGVESTGVWLAWGRACLQCGDFAGARDKFAHCLKVHSAGMCVCVCRDALLHMPVCNDGIFVPCAYSHSR